MLTSTPWGKPSLDVFQSLSLGEVHVWRVFLNDSPEQAARYRSNLSADECARADRYRVLHAKNQFIYTRGILRSLLSHYVRVPPTALKFENTVHGKPRLADSFFLPLRFNVSHTTGMTLLAVTVEHEIGVDVENIDRVLSDQDIASRYFSPRESACFASLSPDHRIKEFLTYWTCKEAYLKMHGIGLRGGLAQCEIVLDPDSMKADVVLTEGSKHENGCSLFRVAAGQAHIGAVAVARSSVNISFWDWPH